ASLHRALHSFPTRRSSDLYKSMTIIHLNNGMPLSSIPTSNSFGRGTPMNFDHSPRAKEYLKKIKTFMKEHIIPAEAEYYAHLEQDGQKWTVPPIMEALKAEAKRQGLWNLFLPDEEYGVGLS